MGGRKKIVATEDRTTDLGVRVFLRGGGIFVVGKKNYVATRDRTTDLHRGPKKQELFLILKLQKKNLEIPRFCSIFSEKKEFFENFDFITKERLVGGMVTISVISSVVFEK